MELKSDQEKDKDLIILCPTQRLNELEFEKIKKER